MSLLSSLASGAMPLATSIKPSNDLFHSDFDVDFSLDNVNAFIKGSIIENDLLLDRQNVTHPVKRPIYDIGDDNLYTLKKSCIRSEKLNISPDSAIGVSSSSSFSNSCDLIDHSIEPSLVTSNSRKFFKSRTDASNRTVEYNRNNFMDHHKNEFGKFDLECDNNKEFFFQLN